MISLELIPDEPVPERTWSWTILGDPVGKGRPRFARSGPTVRTFTPARTAQWEAIAREVFACSWDGGPIESLVELEVTAVFRRPKRLDRVADERQPHGARPDADNVLKAVGDALEKAGVVRNDSQVVRASVAKAYARGDEGPRVEVVMRVAGG